MQSHISSEELISSYLTPEMEIYFIKKCTQDTWKTLKLKIEELLKYLTLAHHESSPSIPVSNEIDELWHLWILQTMQYDQLMKKLPSQKFIHHSSDDYPGSKSSVSDEEYISHQISYLASYVYNYGPFTTDSIKYWPFAQQLLAEKGSIIEFNNYLIELYNEVKQ